MVARAVNVRAQRLGVSADPSAIGIVFGDEYVTLVRDAVRFPNGSLGTYLRVVEQAALHAGENGVVVLPLWDACIILRRVFRHATRQWEVEAPRGMIDPGEDRLQAAERELDEEFGVAAETLIPLGMITANSGLLLGVTAVYAAKLASDNIQNRPDEPEALGEIVRIPFAQILARVQAGEIRDSHTLSAITMAMAAGLLDVKPR
jgi:ADP-ribose pyrophosphatase